MGTARIAMWLLMVTGGSAAACAQPPLVPVEYPAPSSGQGERMVRKSANGTLTTWHARGGEAKPCTYTIGAESYRFDGERHWQEGALECRVVQHRWVVPAEAYRLWHRIAPWIRYGREHDGTPVRILERPGSSVRLRLGWILIGDTVHDVWCTALPEANQPVRLQGIEPEDEPVIIRQREGARRKKEAPAPQPEGPQLPLPLEELPAPAEPEGPIA